MSGYGQEVTLDGVSYRLVQEEYARRFLDVIRQQGGAQDEPSEFSLNPNDLWRRSQTDWVFGQGQQWYDDTKSLRDRYRIGDGVDPFTVEGEISLGPGNTEEYNGSPETYVQMELADDYLWLMRTADTVLERWGGGPSTTVTSAVPQNIVDITTDGANIYIACRDAGKTTGGVYVIEAGSTTPALLNSIIPDKVEYVMGRLMVAAGADIYNITDVSVTTPPDPLTASVVNDSFQWDTFGYSENFILAAGHAGDLSLIYRITIREDGTALTAPVMCAQMPDTEIVTALKPYLGVVGIGTNKGVRVGRIQGPSLQYGPLVEETPDPVEGLEPQGKFMYYAFNGSLHRMDLSKFLPDFPLVPANASYLELPAADVIKAVHQYDGRLHMIQDTKLYSVNASEYSSEDGHFYSGRIWYRMADTKRFYFLDVRSRENHPSDKITIRHIIDGGAETLTGTVTNSDPNNQFVIDEEGEWIEFKFEFTKGSATSSPVLERFTLRSLPLPKRTRQIQVPVDLREKQVDNYGAPDIRDVYSEIVTLESLVTAGTVVDYEEFGQTYKVSVENVQLGPDLDVVEDHSSWEGIVVLTLRIYE